MTDEQIKNIAEHDDDLTQAQIRDILQNTEDVEGVMELIKSYEPSLNKLNREQRRKLQKKAGKKGRKAVAYMTDYAKKLYYARLIEKLHELNEKRSKENNARIDENN